MSSTSLFQADNIYFSYDQEKFIQDYSLKVNEGEKLAIKGESGSGKTTLLRLLLGFEHPSEGKLLYKENSYSTEIIKQMRKEVAWLPQDLNLGAGNTSELINFIFEFQANKGFKPEHSIIVETLEKLGLNKETLASKFTDLSTGQRQRIGLASCYLLKKKVMLLDEPTSALDEQSKQKVMDLLLQDDLTLISTSHDPWWLDKCDRIIELNNQS
jgi:putative ABC transport system ATP-binding protein